MTGLSIFDLDRTITRQGTWTPWLIFWARREAPWRLALLPVAAFAGVAYLLGMISRARLKEAGQRLLMGDGIPRARVESVAVAYAARILAVNVFPKALERLVAERVEGRRIVIATASCEFYVVALAARLGVADVIGTRSVWNGDRLRARLDGDNCYGVAKLRRIEAWLAEHGLDEVPFRFFSDHVSDMPVFERAAECIATTPSPKLRAVAVARGWTIIDWS